MNCHICARYTYITRVQHREERIFRLALMCAGTYTYTVIRKYRGSRDISVYHNRTIFLLQNSPPPKIYSPIVIKKILGLLHNPCRASSSLRCIYSFGEVYLPSTVKYTTDLIFSSSPTRRFIALHIHTAPPLTADISMYIYIGISFVPVEERERELPNFRETFKNLIMFRLDDDGGGVEFLSYMREEFYFRGRARQRLQRACRFITGSPRI